jgi:hypothetical protein
VVGENGPPLDGWVCYPRPCPFGSAPYEVAEDDEPHIIRGTE